MLFFFYIVIFENKQCANNVRRNNNKSKQCLVALENMKTHPGLKKSIFPIKRRIFLPGGGTEVMISIVWALWTYPTNMPSTSHRSPDAALEIPACEFVPGGSIALGGSKQTKGRPLCDCELKPLTLQTVDGAGQCPADLLGSPLCEEPASCVGFLRLGTRNGGLAFQISTFKTLKFRSLFLIVPTPSLTIMQNPNSIPNQGGLESQC